MSLQPILVFVLAVSTIAGAQEIKFIDLSHVEQRTTLRYPPSPSTCGPGNSCVGSRRVGTGVGNGPPDRRDPHALGVSLDYVSTRNVTLDAFDAEFRILNTGLAPIEVPIFPHLSDLQPSDETKPFTYLSLALVVKLETPTEGRAFGLVQLYGATDHEGTIVTLQPGQWVRVKSKIKLSKWPSMPVAAKLRGDFWLRTNVFTPREGGGLTQITNLYPNRTVFPAIDVQFTPTRSQDQ